MYEGIKIINGVAYHKCKDGANGIIEFETMDNGYTRIVCRNCGKAIGFEDFIDSITIGMYSRLKNTIIQMYRDGLISIGKCAELLGVSVDECMKILKEDGGIEIGVD